MISSILNAVDTAESWPAIRADILKRINDSIGSARPDFTPDKPQFEELDAYEAHGLKHISIRYHVIDDEWNTAVIVLPENNIMATRRGYGKQFIWKGVQKITSRGYCSRRILIRKR